MCLLAADSTYSQRSFLFEQCKHKNLVVVARVRSNRVFYQSIPPVLDNTPKRGCPKKYGSKFSLTEPNTWHNSDEITTTQHITRNGRQLKVTIQAWHDMLMRGTKREKMYRHPFTLIRVSVTDDTNTQLWKPMWLVVIGVRSARSHNVNRFHHLLPTKVTGNVLIWNTSCALVNNVY